MRIKGREIVKKKIAVSLIITAAVLSQGFLISCGGGSGGGGAETGAGGGIVITDTSSSSSPGGNYSTSPANGSVTVQWEAPSASADGSHLNDLSGYIIYYGPSSHGYTHSVNVGNSTGAVISSLSGGRWCFAATAYDTTGNESEYSNEECTVI